MEQNKKFKICSPFENFVIPFQDSQPVGPVTCLLGPSLPKLSYLEASFLVLVILIYIVACPLKAGMV
jgi:hypothetical protein